MQNIKQLNTEQTTNSLNELAYNIEEINVNENNPHICIGIGMWSYTNGLSTDLPIDVMYMLISAALLVKKHHDINSKLIILLADSMAERQAKQSQKATKEEINQAKIKYLNTLNHYLNLLNMQDYSTILLTSDVEKIKEYQDILKDVTENDAMKQISQEHYNYVLSQTCLISYLEKYKNVGVKVGWLYKESAKTLNNSKDQIQSDQIKWDELTFDRHLQESVESKMQFLYTKAGLKILSTYNNKWGFTKLSVKEVCPYTTFKKKDQYKKFESEHRMLFSKELTFDIQEAMKNPNFKVWCEDLTTAIPEFNKFTDCTYYKKNNTEYIANVIRYCLRESNNLDNVSNSQLNETYESNYCAESHKQLNELGKNE